MKLTDLRLDEEAWRFTPMLKHLPPEVTAPVLVPQAQVDVTLMGAEFHVGTLPHGVKVLSVPDFAAIHQDDLALLPFKHVKTLCLEISESPQRPLKISVIRLGASEQTTMVAVRIRLRPGVRAQVLQDCQGGDAGLTLQNLQFDLGEDATLDHAVVLRDGPEALQVSTLEYRLQAASTLYQTVLNLGAKLARVQLGVTIQGEMAHAHVASLNALSGKSHVDINSVIRHEVGKSYSTQKAKNFLDGESKGIFTGRIRILPKAQLVEAKQMNRNLLLSRKAHAFGQPQLEIEADDVKCAHGSSTGRVEEEASFYLESRGISPKRTQELLARAFVEEVFSNAQHPELRAALVAAFEGRVS